MGTSTKQRITWVDMVKALGIIAVVFGHAIDSERNVHLFDVTYDAIYWWHMPLFFIIGGFFLKPLAHNWEAVRHFLVRRCRPLLVSYFLIGSILILASHFVRHQSWSYTGFYFVRLLYGGRALNNYLSIFWFINVYLLTLIVVMILITWVPSVFVQWVISLSMFAIGTVHQQPSFLGHPYFPWDAQVVLITTTYMLAGYYGFRLLKASQHNYMTLLAIGIFYLILFRDQFNGEINFTLYLKSDNLNHTGLALIAPLLLCLGIILFSQWLSGVKYLHWLLLLGRHTMIIMFCHRALFDLPGLMNLPDHWVIKVLVGLVLPILAIVLWERFKHLFTLHHIPKQFANG
ncbi:acyltransferase family protein [Sporolactobacillus kofuensis]|uniref:Acyltransferase family protein n=1 Tax=Sporolactobacillus kofuensis TaxID=269672 RepID=A0ABW1WJW3_9BACL|nr:acyltransferase [Sporolactobacillus kofuensis]MCO7176963.1 acyltransferase [Sporolactobacillus kofuensis]